MNWFFVRIARSLATLLLLLGLTFFTLIASSDPALVQLGPDALPEDYAAYNAKFGLDQPLSVQFLGYVKGVAVLDFGITPYTNEPALDYVLSRLPQTMSLMLPVAFFALALGIPLGLFAASRHGRFADQATMTIAVLGLSIPNFLVGIFLMFFFSVKLGWLPPSGIVDWRSYIMPIVTMSTAEAAMFARFTRSSMVEVMNRPMIDTAKAGGLSSKLIHYLHVLPNVALPLLTVAGLFIGSLIGGGVITESVFSWPGMGRALVSAVDARDYAIVQTIVLMIGVTMILANLLVDLAYGIVDPRIRESRKRTGKSRKNGAVS